MMKLKSYNENNVEFVSLGFPGSLYRKVRVKNFDSETDFDIDSLRDLWFKTSYLLDRKQTQNNKALERFKNYKKNKLKFDFKDFTGKAADYGN
jgi:phosphoribosylformylglycinamidine synthase